MERKIGETFEFEGHKLKVVDADSSGCRGCFFYKRDCTSGDVRGFCAELYRTDKENVIFVEVKDEQPQEQAEQPKLNLCEVLKYCPQGETFWSPMFGDLKFNGINKERNFINIKLESGETWNINADGTISFGTTTSPEIMLYPSRVQRDWTKVKYEPKKERFDPKTFKAFDKVLARLNKQGIWCCELFSFIEDDTNLIKCCGAYYQYCIPYNDDTKHLVGTKDEAPEYYRY